MIKTGESGEEGKKKKEKKKTEQEKRDVGLRLLFYVSRNAA